jgi:nucleoside-diphosphate-sugar epimerase
MQGDRVIKTGGAGFIRSNLADISRAKTFGYEPESDFKEELRETIWEFGSNGII